jgi:predicted phage-related endonuclease
MELKTIVENAAELSRTDNEAFAMVRRAGFGASDSSVLLGVNPFPDNTIPKLLEQKRSPVVTADELKIGQMVNVRKGADLEPLILQKFQEKFQVPDTNLEKPEAMFRIGDTPLTVNFDGVLQILGTKVPVECKFVSTYGGKYYNMSKTIQLPTQIYDLMELGTEVNSIYLTRRAEEAGIPIYYYTQIQQQLLALDADFGYLAALFDKDWELRVFTIMADKQVQNKLLEVAEELWKQV